MTDPHVDAVARAMSLHRYPYLWDQFTPDAMDALQRDARTAIAALREAGWGESHPPEYYAVTLPDRCDRAEAELAACRKTCERIGTSLAAEVKDMESRWNALAAANGELVKALREIDDECLDVNGRCVWCQDNISKGSIHDIGCHAGIARAGLAKHAATTPEGGKDKP